jgi:2,3-bisphosphoglycerate-independent phosphoglycerate mutase
VIHLLGLFSDGNVHSHIDHLKALVARAKEEGVRAVRVHVLLDGRDVPETSALDYVEPFEAFLAGLNDGGFDARIASGGGRQNITMDRYEANWALVEKGWRVHVLGAGEQFPDCATAIRALREKHPGTIDQDLPPFVIAAGGQPVGTVEDGDAVVFFNFRGDRAIEITRAFEEADFDKFDRVRHPRVTYAGMLQYDGDLKLPKRFLVEPPAIRDTTGEWFAKWASRSSPAPRRRSSATSPISGTATAPASSTARPGRKCPATWCPIEQRPWMKAAEIADAMIAALKEPASTAPCAATSPTATWSATPATSALRPWPSRRSTWPWRALLAADRCPHGRCRADHRRPRQCRRNVRDDKKTKQPAHQPRRQLQGQDRAHASTRCRSSSTTTSAAANSA